MVLSTLFRCPFPRLLLAAAAIVAAVVGGLALYRAPLGYAVRAQLGQTSGSFLHAMARYERGDLTEALRVITPVVTAGYGPALNMVCGFVHDREPVAPTAAECVTQLEQQPVRRLESLTEIALWAQEWDVAAALLDQRLAEGDVSAHFDRARLIRAAPSGRYTGQDLLSALEQSNRAQDPRGQYAAVILALDVGSQGTLSPVLAEMLDRQPKLRAADAYFELAKLMQTGAVSSDLSYVDVLGRADSGGNPHAARYLAQYYIANPDQDPTGTERLRWMERAAQAGDPVAQYNLAVDILGSPPETRKMEDALALLDRAAVAGFAPAMNLLGATLWQMPRLLPEPEKDVQARAMALMEAAAAQNDVNAHFNLGNIHVSQQALDKGLPHLRKAAELGNEPARAMLVQLGDQAE